MGNTCRGSLRGKYFQGFSQPEDPSRRSNPSDPSDSEHLPKQNPNSADNNNNSNNNNNININNNKRNLPFKKDTIMRRGPDNQAYYVLGHKTHNIRDLYTLGRKLGQGQFGTTYLCTENSTNIEYACKSISKRKLISKEDVEDVRREIQIMHHLAGHKNIVTIKGAYEDPLYVHIVMELCSGGELFDRIIQRGHYTERKAAELTKIIVGVVETCHSLGVMHRDLKPENFLLVNKDDDFSLKAIDFGLSVFFKPGQVFTDVVGSPYYVAPEVLLKHYGPEADVWTAGVILYILLSGVPPFWAETQQGIFDAVLKGHIDFDSDPWPLISDSAKDLIRKMLCSRGIAERVVVMALLSSLCIPSTTHLSTHNHSFSSFSNIHNHSITTIIPFSSFQSLQLSLPYHTPTLLTTKQNPNFTLRFSQQAQAQAEAAPSVSTDEHAEQEVSQTRLLAQNVPWTSTPEDIRSLFERYGKVLQVELSMYNKTKNRGLAFVEMSSPEEARAALQNLESYEFDGRILKLNYAHIKKKKTPPPVKPKPVTFNLFVANLHYEARSKDLKEFFDDGSGSIVSAAVIFHDNPRRSSGYGFVAFKSKKQADSALNEFQGKIFMGRPIRVARGRQFVKERAKESETSEDTASELNGEEADKAD